MLRTTVPRVAVPFLLPTRPSDPGDRPAGDWATVRLRRATRVLVLLLCGLHAYVTRHVINPDGIAYLDVASAWSTGPFAAALNTYWSPLYSWMLAGALALTGAGPYWECALAHAVNLVTLILALLAFEWLLTEVLRTRAADRDDARERWHDLLADWLVVGIACALFVLVSRRWVTVSLLTPDMLLAAAVYAGAAGLLRLRRTRAPAYLLALALGLVLAAGYLAKAVLFPLAFVYLALVPATARGRRGAARFGCAALGFALLAGPHVAALSWARGRPTFGDSGRLNYLWYVNGVSQPGRLGLEEKPLTATGPTRLLERPLVVAWNEGAGSYPLWYDPSRYYEGVRPRVDIPAQLRASASVLLFYLDLVTDRILPFSLTVALLTGFSFFGRRRRIWRWFRGWLGGLTRQFFLLVPALAGLGLYTVVGHAEGRLIAPFVVLVVLALLLAIQVPYPRQTTLRPLGAALLVILAIPLGVLLAHDAVNAGRSLLRGEDGGEHRHWRVSQTLRELGVQPGDRLASVGFTYNAYWARLGRYRVVAEVPAVAAGAFWSATPQERERALDACRRAGARAIVAERPGVEVPGWASVPGTGYVICRLEPAGLASRAARSSE